MRGGINYGLKALQGNPATVSCIRRKIFHNYAVAASNAGLPLFW
jgi:hypothetical protein